VAGTASWLAFNNQPAPVCLAVNRTISTRDALRDELAASGIVTRPTARARNGLEAVTGRPLASAAFASGRFVVQDEASQLIAELAEVPPGATVLDLCASPGGKTLALAAMVGPCGRVVACDTRPHRLDLLAHTLERCRIANAAVVLVAAQGRLPFRDHRFDLVLIDAPCSGLGTIRRDPDIKWRRSVEDLGRFAAAQGDLLSRAAGLVKRGGALVYSTCSSEPEENDDVVAAFRESRRDFSLQRTHLTLPFRDRLEAFFGAVLVRRTSV
jgi:16S rRNA (cytosine967-C5)-methyltransferase